MLLAERLIQTLRPRQNDRHFPDIFKCIFLNKNVWFLIEISPKYVPNGQINNMPAFGSGNALAPTRRQVIIWTNNGQVDRRIHASLALNELMFQSYYIGTRNLLIKSWLQRSQYTIRLSQLFVSYPRFHRIRTQWAISNWVRRPLYNESFLSNFNATGVNWTFAGSRAWSEKHPHVH